MKLIAFSALLALSATVSLAGPASNSAPGNIPEHGRTSFNMELDPAASAKFQQKEGIIREFCETGKANLRLHNFAGAEQDFRSVLVLEHNGPTYLGLAEALVGQGKTAEAMQAYYMVFNPGPRESWGGSYMPKAHLEYALLLNQTGEWSEAVAHYNAALPDLPRGEVKVSIQLDIETPQPILLAAAAHLGLGLYDNWEYEPDSNTRALEEYAAASRLAPSWDAANYYYGVGWQKLSPAERVKFGTAQQAKAALQKAVKIGNANVKAAALKALRNAG